MTSTVRRRGRPTLVPELTYERFCQLANGLLAVHAGDLREVTLERMRAALGGGGTDQISAWLRQWRQEIQTGESDALPTTLAAEIQRAVKGLYGHLRATTLEEVKALEAMAQAREEQLATQITRANEELARSEHARGELERRLGDAEAERDQVREQLHQAQTQRRLLEENLARERQSLEQEKAARQKEQEEHEIVLTELSARAERVENRLREDITRERNQVETLTKRLREAEQRQAETAAREKAAASRAATLDEELKTAREALRTAQAQHRAEVQMLQESVNSLTAELASAGERTVALEREAEMLARERQSLQNRLAQAEQARAESERRYVQLDASLQMLSERLVAVEQAQRPKIAPKE